MALVNCKNQTEQNLKKKAFRTELLELRKTRIKKSSPDMFNFCVVVAGNEIAGLLHAGENSKPHHYQQKYKN